MREKGHKYSRKFENDDVEGNYYLDTSNNPSTEAKNVGANPYLDTSDDDPTTQANYVAGSPYLDISED